MATRSPGTISKRDIVVVAMGDMGGATAILDTEDIAVAAHGLAPESFCWRKYPDHIDLEGVRLKLKNAVLAPPTERLIEGSVKTGWSLSSLGAAWYDDNADRVRSLLGVVHPKEHGGRRHETRRVVSERQRLQQLDAWQAWSDGGTPKQRQACEVFRVDVYTDARTRTQKVRALSEMLGDDATVGRFIHAMAELALREDQTHG